MKTAFLLMVASAWAAAQARRDVIVCDRADAVQCKARVIEGRAVRELAHEGTSVAVGMPVVTAEGDYRVFIRVSQTGPGKIEVKPKNFSGLSSDAAHTRFGFYDKATEINQRMHAQQDDGGDDLDSSRRATGSTQAMGANKAAKLGMRKTDPAQGQDDGNNSHGSAAPGTVVTPEQLYLSQCTLHRGDFAEGFVYLKKPKHSKAQVSPNDPLSEIDIPVNGIVFRFN